MEPRLDDADTAMLREAYDVLQKAQAVHEFVMRQIAVRYDLKPSDRVTIDGKIMRVLQIVPPEHMPQDFEDSLPVDDAG
jgi:hypothetical protein